MNIIKTARTNGKIPSWPVWDPNCGPSAKVGEVWSTSNDSCLT